MSYIYVLCASVTASKKRCIRRQKKPHFKLHKLEKTMGQIKTVKAYEAGPSIQGVSTVRVQTSTSRSQLAQRLTATKALSCDKLSSISLLCSWRPGRNMRVSDLLHGWREEIHLNSFH